VSDVLSITVPIGSRYASVNGVGANGHRAGKKSDAYKQLFADVQRAAEAEIARTGWEKATSECFALIARYLPDRRRADSLNLGKCEWDSLTAAGVWVDDSLANPCLPMIRYNAPHRLAIVVVKLYESVLKPVEANRAATARAPGRTISRRIEVSTNAAASTAWRPGMPLPPGMALLNGKLVTRDVALQKAGIK